MNKISVLCVNQFIDKLNNSNDVFNAVLEVSEWFSKSVKIIGELTSFESVQKELLNLSHYIVERKTLTRRGCNKLIYALNELLKEMLSKVQIILFVTKTVKLKFNKNVKVIVINNEDECINLAYSMTDEFKYLFCVNKDEVSGEFNNAVDIFISLEELIKASNNSYPIDKFTYDRLYLTSKLNKISREQSKILITGDDNSAIGLTECKMPYSATNLGINSQDLYYSLLSVKEGIIRDQNLDVIIISCAYHFFFSNMSENPSSDELEMLSKVNYPIYNKLRGYMGKLTPLYNKSIDSPLYEAIVSLEEVRDVYYSALTKDLEQMNYYNNINKISTYDFNGKSQAEIFDEAKVYVSNHNSSFDLERGLANQKLLDKFLDNMEELNKKVILFVPPVTSYYKENILKDMINAYYQLAVPVINSHKNIKFIDLFNSDLFNENDFLNFCYLNEAGTNKLCKIINTYI